jgi:hypothetical protein
METRQMSEEENSTMNGWMKRRIERSRARCERTEVEEHTIASRGRNAQSQRQGNDSNRTPANDSGRTEASR